MRKRLYSEQRKKLNEQPTKLNGRKRTHKLRGRQRQQQSVSSLMRKRLELPPKGDVKVLLKANLVLARGYESGSSLNGLFPKILRPRLYELSVPLTFRAHKNAGRIATSTARLPELVEGATLPASAAAPSRSPC